VSDDACETISSSDLVELSINTESVDVFDDRPTLRSPLPPPPSTRRTWSTLLRGVASFFTALSDTVSDLERGRRRGGRK
jgi:hypothetical protein